MSPKRIALLMALIILFAACDGTGLIEEESISPTQQQSQSTKPRSTNTPAPQPIQLPHHAVWFAPNFASEDYIDLFTRPEEWQSARQQIDVFQFDTQSMLNDPCEICGDNILPAYVAVDAFRKLYTWGIPISVSVGSVKEWGCTGHREFEVADLVIQNIENNGGVVDIVAMDEPRWYGTWEECDYTPEQIAEKTAIFMNLVHRKYPAMLIGDIEPYPRLSVAEMIDWIMILESQGVDLNFFHLDVDADWVRFEGINVSADLQALEQFLEERGIPFGVIITSSWKQASSDMIYYHSAIQWVHDVNAAIGRPSNLIFQSWWGPAADGTHKIPRNLPENDPEIFSHTRLLLEGLSIFGP